MSGENPKPSSSASSSFPQTYIRKESSHENPIPEFSSLRIATHYKMDHPKRGLALIFNHESYENDYANRRTGTNIDCQSLSNSLTNLGFEVKEYQNLRFKNIEEELKKVSKIDHKDHDCLIVATMTHGDEGGLYAYDCEYDIHTLWQHFNDKECPSLIGKPKIFFIQACRGSELDNGFILQGRTEADHKKTSSIPFLPDFLIVYATAPGHYAWRNQDRGSWFIQALCSVLNQYAKELDLLGLLTVVNRYVAIDFESQTSDERMNEKKQIPCINSMLKRIVQF